MPEEESIGLSALGPVVSGPESGPRGGRSGSRSWSLIAGRPRVRFGAVLFHLNTTGWWKHPEKAVVMSASIGACDGESVVGLPPRRDRIGRSIPDRYGAIGPGSFRRDASGTRGTTVKT